MAHAGSPTSAAEAGGCLSWAACLVWQVLQSAFSSIFPETEASMRKEIADFIARVTTVNAQSAGSEISSGVVWAADAISAGEINAALAKMLMQVMMRQSW